MLHRADKNWVVPFLFWLCIALRILTIYLPVSLFFKPIQTLWKHTAVRFVTFVPSQLRTPLSAVLVIGVYLIGAFASPESLNNTRDNRAVSLFGMLVFVGVLWATSKHRAHVKWHTVLVGMLMQFIIALFVLRTGVGYDIFHFISGLAESLLSFAKDGVAFLTSTEISQLGMFFISVLPAIIFFVALVQLVSPPSPYDPISLSMSCPLTNKPATISCTTGASCNGSLGNLPSSSSGPCKSRAPKPSSPPPPPSSARASRPCSSAPLSHT